MAELCDLRETNEFVEEFMGDVFKTNNEINKSPHLLCMSMISTAARFLFNCKIMTEDQIKEFISFSIEPLK